MRNTTYVNKTIDVNSSDMNVHEVKPRSPKPLPTDFKWEHQFTKPSMNSSNVAKLILPDHVNDFYPQGVL